MGFIYMAQGGDHGRNFVKIAMKLASIKFGGFLYELSNCQLLKRTLYH
jgi:hypothetical protein